MLPTFDDMRAALIVLLVPFAVVAFPSVSRAGLSITASSTDLLPAAGDDGLVARQPSGDKHGTTSLRFVTNRKLDDNRYPPDAATVFGRWPREQPQRDRDLGQTFVMGTVAGRLDAIYLRLGPSDLAVRTGAAGAAIAVQILAVSGSPLRNDHGTPGRSARFDRRTSPELDDFLDGEVYRSLRVVTGRLPSSIKGNDYVRLDFTGADEIPLEAGGGYAFLLMFTERGADRAMALANEFFGSYAPDPKNVYVGHGIRREGAPAFPDAWRSRLAQMPGTLGFPDVCTFRDLLFAVTVKPAPPRR